MREIAESAGNSRNSGMDILRKVFGLTLLFVLFAPASSWAHGFAGQRFFPTTFQVDDPFISDEFSILINRAKGPDATTTEIDIDYSKRIVPNFGLEFHEAYLHQRATDGSSANGWDNLGIGAKWQFLTNAPHELILSVGTDFDIGGTGAHQIADSFTTISPALFFGKGFGDLPASMGFFRPFAITGVIGPSFPTRSGNVSIDPDTGETIVERNPTTLNWAFSLQYSLMYLQSFVKDIGLGAPFNRMILVAEFPMETCMNADLQGTNFRNSEPRDSMGGQVHGVWDRRADPGKLSIREQRRPPRTGPSVC